MATITTTYDRPPLADERSDQLTAKPGALLSEEYVVTLRWVETRQLLPLLRSRLPETWSVTPTQAATVVGEE
jgi:hypothetical protein